MPRTGESPRPCSTLRTPRPKPTGPPPPPYRGLDGGEANTDGQFVRPAMPEIDGAPARAEQGRTANIDIDIAIVRRCLERSGAGHQCAWAGTEAGALREARREGAYTE